VLCAVIGPVPSDYRLHPALAARLLGVGLLLNGVLVVVGTVIIAVLHLSTAFIAVLVALVFAVVLGGLALGRTVVVHLDDEGYRVRFVRGAGVRQARWVEVEEAVTADVAGSPCVVLRLQDGRTTAIPVDAVAGDRTALVREIQDHLQHGHGIRRIG
jgi:hypothetical protein